MNTNDLNARSSLTRRQRRSQAPRVECLESRELLAGYPVVAVSGLVNAALFAHKNTAFQTITGVDNRLRTDLAGPGSPLAVLNAAGVNNNSAQAFVSNVGGVVASYEQGATAQLFPRFPFVYGQIVNHAQSILNGVTAQNALFQNGNINATTFLHNVTAIVRS